MELKFIIMKLKQDKQKQTACSTFKNENIKKLVPLISIL